MPTNGRGLDPLLVVFSLTVVFMIFVNLVDQWQTQLLTRCSVENQARLDEETLAAGGTVRSETQTHNPPLAETKAVRSRGSPVAPVPRDCVTSLHDREVKIDADDDDPKCARGCCCTTSCWIQCRSFAVVMMTILSCISAISFLTAEANYAAPGKLFEVGNPDYEALYRTRKAHIWCEGEVSSVSAICCFVSLLSCLALVRHFLNLLFQIPASYPCT